MRKKRWHVVQTVELAAPANIVWGIVGGFFTIHKWHPDITATEVLRNQSNLSPIRRKLTFPGQPKTIEELILMDNENFHYRYQWYSGKWGEEVQHYSADLRVFEGEMAKRCIVQWSSTFLYTKDAVSQFYWNGFHALQKLFPLPG
jgi:Polyketide cyclase / dehydrase and lipid transport